ncbi:hypothetical protein CVT24_000801 [Panaeolus cyanescens]|uniref:Uncharacterized protein n=1 Tax=Panaeolus cyanescens TaxID=181874 RepID=A0A409YCL5_9AGAR|nr:hypothetical protein CVT24_000801 [Panaeolus cyanescens]
MFTSRIVRNVGLTGNRLMGESPREKTFLYAAGGLAALTGMVYWVGYEAEGRGHDLSKAASEFPDFSDPFSQDYQVAAVVL